MNIDYPGGDAKNGPVNGSGAAVFPRLLSPVSIGNLRLKNRMIMGAMHTRLETMDKPLDREIAFYLARADGGIGLIISGGFSPNAQGRFETDALAMTSDLDIGYQRALCSAVSATGTPFFAQLLHAGRYGKFGGCVAPSAIQAPISRYIPRALTEQEVWTTIGDFGCAAELARDCGYAGIEIMGSEGYLINQFLAARTNQRDDIFGGNARRRMRFAVEIVRAVRKAVGVDFPLIYRISALELVQGGMTQQEILELAVLLEAEGVDCFNTGIGWHESKVPTVSYVTPRVAFAGHARLLKDVVSVPVVASNRINDPVDAEHIIASGDADMISMARQMLADPAFSLKVQKGVPETINTCIACNQACLDKVFIGEVPTCLVNPRALREVDYPKGVAQEKRSIAVVGGGAAGLAMAAEAAERGHAVTLFERGERLGGLLNLARQVPDKTEFAELLRYLETRVKASGVRVKLNTAPDAAALAAFEKVILATGVHARRPEIVGLDHPKVAFYDEVLSGERPVGSRVAIIGSGGIGFDVAEFLIHGGPRKAAFGDFCREYGISDRADVPGGLLTDTLIVPAPVRNVTMLQRGPGAPGKTLSVTARWIKRDRLRNARVTMISGVEYQCISDAGIHILVNGVEQVIGADTIVVCAGQVSDTSLAGALDGAGISYHLIGGARRAGELDAMRAIRDAAQLALEI